MRRCYVCGNRFEYCPCAKKLDIEKVIDVAEAETRTALPSSTIQDFVEEFEVVTQAGAELWVREEKGPCG